MSWFPEEQNIPKDASITPLINTTALIEQVLNCNYAIECDDLTFMIPVGFDSIDRLNNFSACLTYILLNTTAKVKVLWSENEESLAAALTTMGLREGPSKLIFEEFKASSGQLATANDQLVKQVVIEVFFAKYFDGINLDKSTTFSNFQNIIRQDPATDHYRPTKLETIMLDFMKRLDIMVELREESSPFHRTKYLNSMLATVKTPYVVNHDADVIVPRHEMLTALGLLRTLADVDFVYPYGHMDNSRSLLRIVREDVSTWENFKKCTLIGDFSSVLIDGCTFVYNAAYGQSIFARTSSYISAGGENEQFVSWGAEDVERYVRFVKLQYGVARVHGGYVFHLEHERGSDSSSKNPSFEKNEQLWGQLQPMSSAELVSYYQGTSHVSTHGWSVTEKQAPGGVS